RRAILGWRRRTPAAAAGGAHAQGPCRVPRGLLGPRADPRVGSARPPGTVDRRHSLAAAGTSRHEAARAPTAAGDQRLARRYRAHGPDLAPRPGSRQPAGLAAVAAPARGGTSGRVACGLTCADYRRISKTRLNGVSAARLK